MVGLRSYLTRRLLHSVVILAGVSIIVFITVRVIPGDPIRAAMQQSVDLGDVATVEAERARHGLDRPVLVQFAMWLSAIARGDWGRSLQTGEPVLDMFRRRLPITLELFVGATVWAWAIGLPLGFVGALNRNSTLDAWLSSAAIAGVSIPSFWEGIILIYMFAVFWQAVPPSGFTPFAEGAWQNFKSVVLPTFVIGTHGAGLLARYIRSSLLDVLREDFVTTARAKGLSERIVLLKHATKPAAIPVVTVVGLAWGHFVAGSFMVEYIFAIPGLGRMGVDAIFARDFPVIQAMLVAVTCSVLLSNLLVDLAYGYLDPRIRVTD